MVKHCKNILWWQSYHGKDGWGSWEGIWVTGPCSEQLADLFFFPSSFYLSFSFRQISSSGWKKDGLLSRNTVFWVEWWGGWGWRGLEGEAATSLTGKPCSYIFNLCDTTWLMVFLDPLATHKPWTELVSNDKTSTKCTEIINVSCIMSWWS